MSAGHDLPGLNRDRLRNVAYQRLSYPQALFRYQVNKDSKVKQLRLRFRIQNQGFTPDSCPRCSELVSAMFRAS